MMKLYTEEQVKQMFEQFQTHLPFHYEILLKEHMNELTPIELPSDEEIRKLIGVEWWEGAKWMRDKIQGGNNEK
jgi:hypothetical protein